MRTAEPIVALRERIDPLRQALLEHPLYARIQGVDALRPFMEHHVFAVWDFMSLLKSLQRLTCPVRVPWLPPRDQEAARFVNEIVLGEECDLDRDGRYASHFELYYRSMQSCGAETRAIDRLLQEMAEGNSVEAALAAAGAPQAVNAFVRRTFSWIEEGDPCALASAFTFGREDLLPDVFRRVVEELSVEASNGLDDFLYYLNRHIEVDGDQHGPMAERLVMSICGRDSDRWQRAERAAVEALEARLALWDGILEVID